MPYETDFSRRIPDKPIHVSPHLWVGYPAHIEIPEVGNGYVVDALIIHAALPVGLEGPRYILPEELFGDDVVQPDSSPAEMMDAVATRLRGWIDHEYDIATVKGTYQALQLLRNLTKTGDGLATRVLKAHISATLANGSQKARIILVEACYDVISRKDVYDLLGDPDPNVRSTAARSCIPLRPRDPGDDFFPLSVPLVLEARNLYDLIQLKSRESEIFYIPKENRIIEYSVYRDDSNVQRSRGITLHPLPVDLGIIIGTLVQARLIVSVDHGSIRISNENKEVGARKIRIVAW